NHDYLLAATARGLRGWRLARHQVAAALLELIPAIRGTLPGLCGGIIIAESVFSYPGVGSLFYSAVGSFDWPTVAGCLLAGTIFTLLASLALDVLYAGLHPPIRR